MSDTIGAIATGSNLSAIGIIRISGDNAITAVDEVFTPQAGEPMRNRADRTLVYGDLKAKDGTLIDKCLCTISRAPNSYTGENTAELQCHGSPTVLRMALESLFAAGARQALPGEFTKRAFLNGRMDLTQAEAVIDLIEAETKETAQNAAGQLGGAIQKKINSVYDSLVDIISHYHAVLDYPDEEIEAFEISQYLNVFKSAENELKTLLDTFERGRIMKSGIRTVILGKPNVGKSTLLNTLLGYDRAIVTPIAGTTRDTIEEAVIIGGVKLRLIDTAGLRKSKDPIEQQGIDRSKIAAQNADLALVVIDSSRPITEEDFEALKAAHSSKCTILVLNKIDVHIGANKSAAIAEIDHKIAPIDDKVALKIPLSSLTGEGTNSLETAISELFSSENAAKQGEILTNSRQFDAISRAHEFLKVSQASIGQGSTPDIVLTETENALSALGELTGKTLREDVTKQIFERFCVGK